VSLSRLRALTLLDECTGIDIWPVEHCRSRGVPEDWIDALADAHESGFQRDEETIYLHQHVVNQFHGISDLSLAMKLGEFLGVDVDRATSAAFSRTAIVRAIKEAVDES
jgi:hypothetical protein